MVNNTFSCSEIVRIPLLGGVRGGLLIAARCSHQEPTPAPNVVELRKLTIHNLPFTIDNSSFLQGKKRNCQL